MMRFTLNRREFMKSFSKTKWVMGFAIVAGLAACGKSKLTEEQKAKVQRLAKSSTSGMSATLEAGGVGNGGGGGGGLARALPGPVDSNKLAMKNQIRAGHCDFETFPKNIDEKLGRIADP